MRTSNLSSTYLFIKRIHILSAYVHVYKNKNIQNSISSKQIMYNNNLGKHANCIT